jgi:AMP nucleosidase
MQVTEGKAALEAADVKDVHRFTDVGEALDYALEIYEGSKNSVQDLIRQLNEGKQASSDRALGGYPVMGISVDGRPPSFRRQFHRSSYGWFRRGAGMYASEFSQIDVMRSYLEEELPPLLERYETELLVGRSSHTYIPIDLALNGSGLKIDFDEDTVWEYFVRPQLDRVQWAWHFGKKYKFNRLAHYEAISTDMMLHRLLHYTGTDPKKFQRFVFFTNFKHHLKPFMEWGEREAADPNSECTGVTVSPGLSGQTNYFEVPDHPAVHVEFPNGRGITMINIQVGAPNVWKIVDCLAALRLYGVVLLGICGGLRQTHRKGTFVLFQDMENDCEISGHRNDRRRGAQSPEIQLALSQGICQRLGVDYDDSTARAEVIERVKGVSTSNRGWEWREDLIQQYCQDTNIGAIEMEAAAVIKACSYHRIPSAFGGIISDVPVAGDFRLPGTSSEFFRQNVEHHVMSAVNAWQIMRKNPQRLQSRLLREDSFYSPLR